MNAVQAANDRIADGLDDADDAAADAAADDSAAVDDADETDGDDDAPAIGDDATSAEIEAYRAAATAALRASSSAAAAPSGARRGAWELVVGVVGKPSAGKSTFFNAVTRATGAISAKVAAYPFTTIDPNVREGLYACLDPDPAVSLGREPGPCPPHGRDASGRRLLPVLLKDVAGLVPGAYAGAGKGNRFLNDLVDADAFVHVVDASAETDASGAAADAADAAEDALAREVSWVREEVHRWIAGNVARKWHSVRRLASRGRAESNFRPSPSPRNIPATAERLRGIKNLAGTTATAPRASTACFPYSTATTVPAARRNLLRGLSTSGPRRRRDPPPRRPYTE